MKLRLENLFQAPIQFDHINECFHKRLDIFQKTDLGWNSIILNRPEYRQSEDCPQDFDIKHVDILLFVIISGENLTVGTNVWGTHSPDRQWRGEVEDGQQQEGLSHTDGRHHEGVNAEVVISWGGKLTFQTCKLKQNTSQKSWNLLWKPMCQWKSNQWMLKLLAVTLWWCIWHHNKVLTETCTLK